MISTIMSVSLFIVTLTNLMTGTFDRLTLVVFCTLILIIALITSKIRYGKWFESYRRIYGA